MEYLKFETAFHNARVNLSTKIYQTPFYGVVEEMVHFKCTIPKLLTYSYLVSKERCLQLATFKISSTLGIKKMY